MYKCNTNNNKCIFTNTKKQILAKILVNKIEFNNKYNLKTTKG